MIDQNGKIPGDGHHDGKDKKYSYTNQETELKQVRVYLTENNATATMCATALSIYRPNLTRYKAMLQDEGVLIVTHNDRCKETNCKADYLSCNPDLVKGGANGRG